MKKFVSWDFDGDYWDVCLFRGWLMIIRHRSDFFSLDIWFGRVGFNISRVQDG